MKRILIRADDLGYSEGVNYGIAKSVKDGIIKNVGVMVNMPFAEHGLQLLKQTDICFGQHTNICVGKPITNPSLIPSIVKENGEFKSSKDYRNSKEDFVILDEVILEIEAQYQRFLELIGEPPHYFEGHAVSSKNFFKGLQIVAQKHGLKYSGFSTNNNIPITVGETKVYIYMDSMKPDYNPLDLLKYILKNAHKDSVNIMVCHPGYLDSYILKNSSLTIPRTLEVEMLCSEETKEIIKEEKGILVTYDEL